MYQCYYNFWTEDMFPGFKNSLINLNAKSKNKYINNTPANTTSKEAKNELDMIDTTCRDIEYYLISLTKTGVLDKKNIGNVLTRLEGIDSINILKKEHRNYYGLTNNKEISVNPTPKLKADLSDSAMKQLLVSHELGHIINNSWNSDMQKFVDELYDIPQVRKVLKDYNLNNKSYLEFGFNLLDEAISQDTAERVTYRKLETNRPLRKIRTDKAILNHQPYYTNFVFYGEFQDIAINFAKTLNFIGINKNDNYDEVLRKLSKKAFDKNFINNIRHELYYEKHYMLEDFVVMLACMGKMKKSTYSLIGLSPKQKSVNETKRALLFNNLSKSNDSTTHKSNKQYSFT